MTVRALRALFVVVHTGAAAVWLGAMVYSIAVVQPRAQALLGDRYERFARTLAAGARWKVLGLVAALALSGGGLIGLEVADDTPTGFWWALVAAKAALLLGAVALFAYVSWWLWPSRLFANPDRLPGLQRRFTLVAVTLTAVVAAGLVLGGVADAFR
jgi:hypothetical protein